MAKYSLRLFKRMMVLNMKAMQILKKILHWKHPIFSSIILCIVVIVIDTITLRKKKAINYE